MYLSFLERYWDRSSSGKSAARSVLALRDKDLLCEMHLVEIGTILLL